MPRGILINDEFTALPLSRARKWQLRRKRDGLCVSCGKPAINSHYCEFHQRKTKEYALTSRKKNPLVYAAYRAVSLAILSGRLVRQRCEIDGCNRWGESHHEDYSKPLDVRWLCKQHHNEAHGNRKRHAARQLVRYHKLKAEQKVKSEKGL